MKIALIQSNTLTGAPSRNMRLLMEAASRAAGLGADLCVAPELALCGHNAGDLLLQAGFAEKCRNVLEQAATAWGGDTSLPPLLLGAPVANPVPQGNRLQNCAVLLHEGKVRVVGRKVLLPSEGVHDDPRYFEPGVACGVLQLKGWRFAVTIGEDVWNERDSHQGQKRFDRDPVAEFMAGVGADAVLHLTALPYEQGLPVRHQRVLAQLATRYRTPVAAVNLVGGNDSLVYYGGSFGLDDNGVLRARAPFFEESLLLLDMDGGGQGATAPDLPAEEELWRAVVLGTRDYARKCGFDSAVFGMSGGADSSLVACIAAEAFGPEKVTGLLMPSPYSSRGSVEDARLLAQNLNMTARLLPITPVLDAFGKAFAGPFSSGLAGLAEENIQARIRCSLLMAHANSFGSLLLGTGNKSEAAVGYATLYGDMTGGIEPIGDLYKQQVYALCRWYNERHGSVIPEEVLTKAPSAELRPDQKDADTLPPYDVLDPLLQGIVEDGEDIARLMEKGHDARLASEITHLVRRAEFKRRQAPPALRVSRRGFGGDWRFPVAADDEA